MKRSLRKVEADSSFDDIATEIVTKSRKEESKNKEPPLVGEVKTPTIQNPSVQKQKYNVRFDYAAGLCKDYLETGYCGFGDSCIFLHDRGDYKMGWELDADFERQHQQKPDDTGFEIPEPVDPSLTECPVCKRPHEKARMLPECGHRFCMTCIVNALKTRLKCPLCKAVVSGTLKPVPKNS